MLSFHGVSGSHISCSSINFDSCVLLYISCEICLITIEHFINIDPGKKLLDVADKSGKTPIDLATDEMKQTLDGIVSCKQTAAIFHYPLSSAMNLTGDDRNTNILFFKNLCCKWYS